MVAGLYMYLRWYIDLWGGGVQIKLPEEKSHLNCDAGAIDYTILCENEDV